MSRLSPDDVLLGLLTNEDSHGYQLLEHFRAPEKLGRVWHLSVSQLYAILKRLEQKDFIQGREVESEDAPPRTVYRLTEAGRVRFDCWLHKENPSASTRRIRTEFLSRLYIARLLNLPVAPIIKHQKAACQQHQKTLIEKRDQTVSGTGYLSLDLLVSELGAILQWLDRCESNLAGEHNN